MKYRSALTFILYAEKGIPKGLSENHMNEGLLKNRHFPRL